jgi:glycine/sarcosine N-methyltransferase
VLGAIMEVEMPDTREFYDALAGDYTAIFQDWSRSSTWQGELLDRLIGEALGPGPKDILDCSCGVGTQALGLAARGHRLTATDLSPRSVERAAAEARARGLEIAFGVADLRALAGAVPGDFDAVISCDNALPHLLSADELSQAAREIRAKLRPGGLFLASIRDYDALLAARPTATPPAAYEDEGGRRISFQLWRWRDELIYDLELFILREAGGSWSTARYEGRYRALRREELSALLAGAGFGAISWRAPGETGYYQPIATARPR